jgi:hypothetical protein
MAFLTHHPAGWRIEESVSSRDEKGNEVKRKVLVSACNFISVEEALAYARVVFPAVTVDLKCDACGSSRDVQPEPVGTSFMLTCKRCRAVPGTYSPPSDAEAGKPCKKPRVNNELNRDQWLAATRAELRRFDMETTGVPSLDQALRLPKAPKHQPPVPAVIAQSEAPEECQVCGGPVTDRFVVGVVKGAGWAYLCEPCHRRDGIGLGTGRGRLYAAVAGGDFHKIEG